NVLDPLVQRASQLSGSFGPRGAIRGSRLDAFVETRRSHVPSPRLERDSVGDVESRRLRVPRGGPQLGRSNVALLGSLHRPGEKELAQIGRLALDSPGPPPKPRQALAPAAESVGRRMDRPVETDTGDRRHLLLPQPVDAMVAEP